ncbi:hypothetical protein [Conexibacter sp. CPCC 206217]|uniref:hypothetical protein n=1 Tax=Conexibacter sp. CPCC 206217 TaxID=3064574 RepID=UPI0027263323|nr:hypothetical protein [Conexibacter sp. CPCC 206217]MDO8213915.1 hypothetical protein [Conexibacter sp. CPCC 206217]
MPQHDPQRYETYADFLLADPRRDGDALECGHDWLDNDNVRYRVCWYSATGELTLERLSRPLALELEDFAAGISGPIEILAILPTRARMERVLGTWPQLALLRSRRVADLRSQVTLRPTLRLVHGNAQAR